MICICEEYVDYYNIIFNPAKSKLLYYNVTYTNLIIELCGQPINVVTQETYLGNYIGVNIFDRSITQNI